MTASRGEAPQAQAERAAAIRTMFGRITPRYDRMNRLMSAGMDGRWRQAAAAAAEPRDARVLDLGAGTGDLSRELRRQGARVVVAADFTHAMLLAGRAKPDRCDDRGLRWLQADALQLPFPDASFDAVTSGFLLRNLVDLPAALAEMVRVLVPGGRLVALDITQPPPGPYGALLRFGFRHIVTPLAGALSGDAAAYHYLPHSLDGYPTATALAGLIEAAGAEQVRVRRLGAGSMALHRGLRPPLP